MNHAVFQLKNVHFWSNVLNEIRHWWAQVTFQGHHGAGASDARPLTIRNVKNTRSSLSSSFLLLPSPFPVSSFFSSWPPKTPQFLGKKAKIVIMMSIFDPTRGSYSLGRVLLRRNTLYIFHLYQLMNIKIKIIIVFSTIMIREYQGSEFKFGISGFAKGLLPGHPIMAHSYRHN